MISRFVRLASLVVLTAGLATPAAADVYSFLLHDHPNGDAVPPTYGLRLDELIQAGEDYTFSFDYIGVGGAAEMHLEYFDGANEIHIFGRVYGGRDIGGSWDPAESGWVDVDFTYRENIIRADDIYGNPGDDIYVLVQDANNNGTIALDGWGGDAVYAYTDKASGGYSFIFDSDEDSKGNATIANDPTVWSAAGWLMGPGMPNQDWLFIGDLDMTVPTQDHSVGQLKSRF